LFVARERGSSLDDGDDPKQTDKTEITSYSRTQERPEIKRKFEQGKEDEKKEKGKKEARVRETIRASCSETGSSAIKTKHCLRHEPCQAGPHPSVLRSTDSDG
jgi:hypothetical protein